MILAKLVYVPMAIRFTPVSSAASPSLCSCTLTLYDAALRTGNISYMAIATVQRILACITLEQYNLYSWPYVTATDSLSFPPTHQLSHTVVYGRHHRAQSNLDTCLQVLTIATRRPASLLKNFQQEQQEDTNLEFMLGLGNQLPGLLVRALPWVLHSLQARTGNPHFPASLLQWLVQSCVAAIAGYAQALEGEWLMPQQKHTYHHCHSYCYSLSWQRRFW